MRKLIRHLIASVLIVLGFVRRQNKRVHSKNLITPIYFHNPSKELFEKCINWLIKNDYYFISTDDLYNVLKNKKVIKNGAVCITVDDGWKDNIENIMPIVTKLQIPLTIFIATEPVKNGAFWWSYIKENNKNNHKNISVQASKNLPNIKRKQLVQKLKKNIELPREAMTKEDVIRISKFESVTIGNHTVNHPITNRCEIDELNYEITEGSSELKNWIVDEVAFFAYPNGDFDEREAPFLNNNNIKLAFTTVPKHINSTKTINHFQVPRFCVNDNGSFSENICKMVGVWQKYIE
ncbi:polysaccharide deacetylase family protein [Winogradskyella sp. UBA3174]|uniref:polysaccharide deacetylase family protein n=1 Tax=Winogradskyella sp. UBA3174 TaxID=1947785 RepID=UPI00260088AF|nr:polysaccharide deacetylase family protein [Winogradskyella sp. UBA3174]|tara:strand:+ start:50013 stop:50891 length:879 start_codon:yes stop_codon:yes gene_type:complete